MNVVLHINYISKSLTLPITLYLYSMDTYQTHISSTSWILTILLSFYKCVVIPIAIAASFDVALDLNHGGVDDQFNKLVSTVYIMFQYNY